LATPTETHNRVNRPSLAEDAARDYGSAAEDAPYWKPGGAIVTPSESSELSKLKSTPPETPNKTETVARLPGQEPLWRRASPVKEPQGLISRLSSRVAQQIAGNALDDVSQGANATDGLLHFLVPTIGPLHGVAGSWQGPVIQEGQRLLDVGGKQALESFTHVREALHPLTQASRLGEGRLGSATPVAETIDLVHHGAQGAQVGQATGDTCTHQQVRCPL
jgi:hypothetical protein